MPLDTRLAIYGAFFVVLVQRLGARPLRLGLLDTAHACLSLRKPKISIEKAFH